MFWYQQCQKSALDKETRASEGYTVEFDLVQVMFVSYNLP